MQTPCMGLWQPLHRAGPLVAAWILISAASAFAQTANLDPMIGYQCPDGTQWNVVSCYDHARGTALSNEASCGVLRLDLPPRNGFQVRVDMLRGELVKRLSGCEAHRVSIAQGNVTMGAAIPRAPAPAARASASASSPQGGGARPAARQASWGSVKYSGLYGSGEDDIIQIGDMPVITKSHVACSYVTQIGNMPVETATATMEGECAMVRIGDLDVDYVFDGPFGQVRYTRIGDMPVESEWCAACGPHGRWQMTYIGRR